MNILSQPLRIGVALPHGMYYSLGVLQGIGTAARRFSKVEFVLSPMARVPEFIESFDGDGLLVWTWGQDEFNALLRRGIPSVCLRGRHEGEELPRVTYDFPALGRRMAQHLLNRGYRRFAFFGRDDFHMESICEEILTGIEEATRGVSPPCDLFYKGPRCDDVWTLHGQLLDLADWIRSYDEPLGLMAVDDEHALRCQMACRLAHRSCPSQVGIAGVMNMPEIVDVSNPLLTSISLNQHELGFQAFDTLVTVMSGRRLKQKSIIVPPGKLFERESTASFFHDDELIAQARSLIHEEAATKPSVQELADQLHVSRRTLERRFKKATGQTPAEAWHDARLELAHQLIVDTDKPMLEIALDLEMDHVSHLSRMIRQAYGQTPTQLRKRSRDTR